MIHHLVLALQNPVMTFFSRACKIISFASDPFGDEHLIEECEVFGIFGFSEARMDTALGYFKIANILFELSGIPNHYFGQ